MRVLIYEHICGGGMRGEPLPPDLAAAGAGMLQAAVEDFVTAGCEVVTTLDSRVDLALQGAHVESFTTGDVVPVVEKLAQGAHTALIIAPESRELLQTWAQRLHEWDIPSLGSSAEAIALCANKFRTANHLKDAGIPTPPGIDGTLLELLHAVERTFSDNDNPFVLKQLDGAGCEQTYVIKSVDDARALRGHVQDDWGLAQSYVDGPSISVSFIVTPKKTYTLLPGVQHMDGAPVLHYTGGTIPATLERTDVAVEVARKAIDTIPGLHGFVGVDLVVDEETGIPWVVDINPRLTVSYCGLRRLSKVNLADVMLQRAETTEWKRGNVTFDAGGRIVEECL